MSLLTASRHKAAACSDGTHPDQEVTAPEAFGLWCKRQRLLEHGSETSPEHRLSFHLLAQLPAAAGTGLQPSEGGLNTLPPSAQLETSGFQ